MKNTTLQEAKAGRIATYWWNMGKKKNDFNGTYAEWLKAKGVKVKKERGYILISFSVGHITSRITLTDIETSYGIKRGFDYVIQTYLTYLGDRAFLYSDNRKYKINWR